MSHLEFVRGAVEHVRQNYASLDEKQLRIAVVRELIDRQVSDLVGVSRARLERLAPADAQELAEQGFWIEPSAELAEQKRELEQFLYERVYRHPSLIAVRSEAQQQLRELFDKLVAEPQHLSAKYARRAEQVGLRRAVVEYLAGMTDHYCRQIHQQLVAGAPGP
jgi:dGTPase